MLFTSYGFLTFLAAVLILYYTLCRRFQWQLLLAASYLFYYWSGPKNLIFILVTTVTTYFAALKIGHYGEISAAYIKENKAKLTKEERKAYKAGMKKLQRKWMLACLFLNLGILAVLKYTNFAIANINFFLDAFHVGEPISFKNMILPMGISFYTFMAVGYLVDVYRGKYPAKRGLFSFALFISFFPQVVQGPISRFDDVSGDMWADHKFDRKAVFFGLQRILWGFFKKLVIADRILTAVNTIIHDPATYDGIYVFLGMMFYALELYADFTGGIDITIGTAELFGIPLKENFHRPYFSKNIAEYWRRWHITMGTWFTDYIFYPISVSDPMLRFNKFARKHFGEYIGKRMPVYTASAVVWFATGIWHGAAWNFIAWGMMNFVVLMVSQELEPCYKWFHKHFSVNGTLGYKIFQVVRTILLMSALRMFDCYRDVPLTFRMFGNMLVHSRIPQLFDGRFQTLGLAAADYLVLFIGLMILIVTSLIQRSGSVREKLAAKPLIVRFACWYGLFLAVLIFGAYGVGFDSSQFIYNQF